MFKKLIFPIILLILLSSLCFGFSTYNYNGEYQYDATDEYTYFNENTNNITKYLKLLSVPTGEFNFYQPLINDIDNDGIKEVIYMDYNNLYIANISNQRINIEQSIEIYATGSNHYPSSPVIADLNDDGIKEIYYTLKSSINQLIYNGSGSLITKNSWESYNSNPLSPYPLVCDDSLNYCVYLFTSLIGNYDAIGILEDGINYKTYNTTVNSLLSSGCHNPQGIILDDLDYDNNPELVLSFRNTFTGTADLKIYELNEVTLNITSIKTTSKTSTGGAQCSTGTTFSGNLQSTPYVYDIIEGGYKEVAYAVVESYETLRFKIYQYDNNLNQQNVFPLLDKGNGLIVGNMFKAKVFDDTDNAFCVMGYNSGKNYTEVVCGSKDTGFTGATRSFGYTSTYNTNTHSVAFQYSNSQMSLDSNVYPVESDSTDYFNEFMTTYGVLKPTNSYLTYLGIGFYNMELIWSNPYEHASVLPIDYNDDGHNELFIKNNENIIYVTDGYTTLGCGEQNCADIVTINPSNNAIWLINTSFELTVKTQEKDNYPVNARLYIYYGTDNQQMENTSYYNVGTTIPLGSTFQINKSISSGKIRLELTNNKYPLSVGVYEYVFSVSDTNGIVFSDAINTINYLGYNEEQTIIIDNTIITSNNSNSLNVNDNFVKNLFDTLTISKNVGYTGSSLIIILITIACIIFYGIKYSGHMDGGTILISGVVAIIEFILFVYLKMIPISFALIVLVVSLAILGIFFKSIFGSKT